jgi:heptosyltransferase-2
MSTEGPLLSRPRHLLVRLPNPLGDAVMATPALRALRRALPDVRITWAGGPAAQAILEGLPYRDGVVPLAGPMVRGGLAPVRAGRFLRGLAADTVLLLPNSRSSALAARLARIPVRVGSNLRRRGRLLTNVVDLPLQEDDGLLPRPMTDHYMDLVAPFGGRADGRRTELASTPFDEERAQRRLAGVPAGTRLVGVNPGAAFAATKILPAGRIAEAISRIRSQADVLPLVLCGPGEEALARETALAIGEPCLSVADHPPSLGELKALARRISVLLTTDTGPRHVAEAFGVPTVVWMGPTDPRWSEGGGARVVRNEELACLGCHLKKCPIGIVCMTALDPARIADAALRSLQ